MDPHLEQKPEVRFSEKIWCLIFRNLHPVHLRQARLVCRNWNQIITSSSALMEKQIFQFPPGMLQDRNSEGFRLLSTSKTHFTRICFDWPSCDILEIPLQSLTWITELVLVNCTISIQSLPSLLKETVNLRKLHIGCSTKVLDFFNIIKINFKLQFLEVLILENQLKLLDEFKGFCPRLKILDVFETVEIPAKLQRALFEFVSTVPSTLKEIHTMNVNAHSWKMIARIEGLRLVLATGLELQDSELIRFTAMQTALEQISIKYQSTEVLRDICSNLPRLRTLKVTDLHSDNEVTYTFLDFISTVQTLTLHCPSLECPSLERKSMKFENFNHQQLQKVVIIGYIQAANADWFQNFPNLRSVELIFCRIESWSTLFASLSTLQHLQNLVLGTIDVKQSCASRFYSLESLRYLSLSCTELSKTNFKAMMTQCPDLRHVYITSMQTLDDDDISMVCKKVRLLRLLRLTLCDNITDNTVDHIGNFCLNLEDVCISGCQRITAGAVQRMKIARKEILVRFN